MYSYLLDEALFVTVARGSIKGKTDVDQLRPTRSSRRIIAFTNSMSRLFTKASGSLSSRPSTKVRQIGGGLNGKRFQLTAIVVRLIPNLIAKVTVAYLIPFIAEIPALPEVFFLMAHCRSLRGAEGASTGRSSFSVLLDKNHRLFEKQKENEKRKGDVSTS